MINNKVIYIVFYFISIHFVYSQSILEKQTDIENVSMPQEGVYIHHNTTLLFSGEYLYYKLYCINLETNKKSHLSKVAYVELVGEDKQIVFKHKVKLNDGNGQGDFFVPVSVPSGNYKLLGYTEWMKNEGLPAFFQGDIGILNPYQGNQKKIVAHDSIELASSYLDKVTQQKTSEETIKLVVDSKTITNRKEVSLKIKNTQNSFDYGDYSLSVRKIDTIETPYRYSAIDFFKQNKKKTKNTVLKESLVLPELRGELISGKIIPKNPLLKIANKKIALSIPNKEDYQFKIAITDKKGRFYFNLDKEYKGNKALLQILGNEEGYEIRLSKQKDIIYSDIQFPSFKITPKMKDMILERSVNNQIRNAYFTVKPDTINELPIRDAFYGNEIETYYLDDYTRFATVKETVVEILDNIWIDKNKKGKEVLQVRRKRLSYNKIDLLPLVIVDGVMIQEHGNLIAYNAKKIKSIKLSRDKYFYGSQVFLGIIDIVTNEGDFHVNNVDKNVHPIKLFNPLPEKKYFYQKYDEASKKDSEKIPDFRRQLLWIPRLKINKEEKIVNFYTSDISGVYEICLEGFNQKGTPVSVRTTITVE
ncbi:hypothetical protein [Aquimarina sp. I32.4]|uniref:hypothetical protein n=1 Tax=Aquimarina sp. I32.4 TaxID=2053903 RepID=UPI000CDE91B7|nr:hypothetical protein [Aquimarina sp. I32.4]